jgi:mannose-1-phosphate guanylyltransferase
MAPSHLYGLILAGGRGTRFWPRSRRGNAKQVLRFFGEHSLIQQTVKRLAPILPPERLWILTNDHLHAEIVRQLPEVPKRQIIAEPAQRNTAPAIGLAAHILQSIDPHAVMGVFPADHVIGRDRQYVSLLRPAFRAAREGKIVVLGIQPRWPETGYGYIEFPSSVKAGLKTDLKVRAKAGGDPVVPVLSFREKPDLPTAERFLASGTFYWNAGMFFWRTAVILEGLQRFLPKTASLISGLPAFQSRQFHRRMLEIYPQCENISIDYAVIERASNVAGIAAGDFGWNDVGSWNAVYELHPHDVHGNACRADALLESSSGNYVDADKKMVALLGVKDLIIVDTPDALLVADRSRAQQVGDLVKRLEKAGREELL